MRVIWTPLKNNYCTTSTTTPNATYFKWFAQLTKAKKKINNDSIEEHGLSKNHKIMVDETKMKNNMEAIF